MNYEKRFGHLKEDPHPDLVERFIEEAEADGLFTRHYEGEIYCTEMCRMARMLWHHMCSLDGGNLPGFIGAKDIANAYARAMGPINRTFK